MKYTFEIPEETAKLLLEYADFNEHIAQAVSEAFYEKIKADTVNIENEFIYDTSSKLQTGFLSDGANL